MLIPLSVLNDCPSANQIIELAQASLSLYLCGQPDALEPETAQQEGVEITVASMVLPIQNGPISSLQSLRVNGTAVDLNRVSVGWWQLELKKTLSERWGFKAGDFVEIKYKRGWPPNNPPPVLRAALLAEAQAIQEQGDEPPILEEKLGRYAVVYAAPQTVNLVSGQAARILAPLRSWQVLGVY